MIGSLLIAYRGVKLTLVRLTIRAFYRIKIKLLQKLLGPDAIEVVLYNSLFPDTVLNLGGALIGQNVRINRWLTIHGSGGSFKQLTIGDDVHVGKFVLIDLVGPVTIGNRVGIGMFSKVLSHQELGDTELKKVYPRQSGPVIIPDDVVLSASSIMLYPTRLVSGTLVGAGAVVRGEYDKPCILIGNPARVVAHLPHKV